MLMSNNVFDCKREHCWFCCKLYFCYRISWENGILPVFPSLPLFTAYFQQPCNCFPFSKRNIVPFLVFLLIVFLALSSDVWEHWWECHVRDTNLALAIKARSLLGEAVLWWGRGCSETLKTSSMKPSLISSSCHELALLWTFTGLQICTTQSSSCLMLFHTNYASYALTLTHLSGHGVSTSESKTTSYWM